ncbi:hypothetical protein [Rhizobium leguminosarum]|uniref:hypothetical protein n=1 Tax=Rhizobium leguminosarum TaxID=384 RepID=UPI0014426F49|nr:hypothetical protein [Rhizobium leguminosarum]MBY5863272.1 hypothetical protein [Rhizobium leguminosarum]NKM04152.1 hypothetical protein [Rhizobium leguminosarum bv. viciae]
MSTKEIVFHIAAAGGEIEISLWGETQLAEVNDAQKQGLVKTDAAGWGDRTVVKLTPKGREFTGMPVKKNPFMSALDHLRLR